MFDNAQANVSPSNWPLTVRYVGRPKKSACGCSSILPFRAVTRNISPAHSEDRAEEIRARAQVGYGAQELRRVALLLQWIGGVHRADQLEARCPKFPFLARRGRGH